MDVTKLTALSPEVISRQATINIGTIGHVAHGKSTVVKAVSGVQTVRFKNELERNITIKLDSSGTKGQERSRRVDNVPWKIKKRESANGGDGPRKKRACRNASQEEDYEVEKVVQHKLYRDKHMYLVKWVGWDESSNTWEPSQHLEGCHDELFNFLDDLTKDYEYDEVEYERLRRKLTKFTEDELRERIRQYVTPKEIKIPVPDPDMIDDRLRIVSKWPAPLRDPYVCDTLRVKLLDQLLYARRQEQLDALKEWEDEMNTIILRGETSIVSVVNNVDLEGPPQNFIYINDYLPGENVHIPEDPPFGCDCESSNCSGLRKKCCPTITGSRFAYDRDGRVKLPQGSAIYECNKRCKCGAGCVNRVVQRGRRYRLGIFRTATGCGWGVKALEDIPRGAFVCEYVGEVISFDEAERRGEQYDRNGQTYLFDLDFNDTNNHPYTVDAAVYGNVSHFVNHSCDPNMTVYAVWVNCLDPNLPKLALFANRDIRSGQEISFDYLNQRKGKKDMNDVSHSSENGKEDSVEMRGMVCKCGSKKCRKFYL